MPSYFSSGTPASFKSKYNPLLCVHSSFLERFNGFLHKIFLDLANALVIPVSRFQYLDIEQLITDRDFEDSEEVELAKSYFYAFLFKDIKKHPSEKVISKVKYTFTFDKSLAPLEKNGCSYGVIKLGRKPVFYYCYVDFQQAMDFLKTLS